MFLLYSILFIADLNYICRHILPTIKFNITRFYYIVLFQSSNS